MIDIQSQVDDRGVFLDNVGVKNVKVPLKIKGKNGFINTVANFSLYVSLDNNIKGTHMSRFIEILNDLDYLDFNNLKEFLIDIKNIQKADNSSANIDFSYFIKKKAPSSEIESFMDINCNIEATLKNDVFNYILTVIVPVTTLCPCSKEISEYGAHNQKATITVSVQSSKIIFIEDLVELIEKNGSCEVYSLLKRTDEKFVTEKAYNNPKFVEDVARDIYIELNNNKNILSFEIEVESQESIHNHNAVAKVSKKEI